MERAFMRLQLLFQPDITAFFILPEALE